MRNYGGAGRTETLIFFRLIRLIRLEGGEGGRGGNAKTEGNSFREIANFMFNRAEGGRERGGQPNNHRRRLEKKINEQKRIDNILAKCDVVEISMLITIQNWANQISERVMKIKGRRQTKINKAIFGTGDSLGVLTLTIYCHNFQILLNILSPFSLIVAAVTLHSNWRRWEAQEMK